MLLLYGSFIFALTKLCFGTLRAFEVEQLTERAWFAITETCLAMTIFRDEIGAWFIVMFTALVTGKVWGWIGEGRVEFLEQQPPANPRLFHTRLSISLAVSFVYDILILRYCVGTVIQQARPNMMVMFLFEFAVLAICSWRTGVRYILSLIEQSIVKRQTQARLAERRREVRTARENEEERRNIIQGFNESVDQLDPIPHENDVDEMDIEVPGWAAKGEWVLWLDLFTDMFKLAIYVAFFFMLLLFYGLPIHIMRDLLLTARDFVKRLSAILRYRKAIQEMNKYLDATQEDLDQENTCIICREEMRVWDQNNNDAAVDRIRPKKLPCGHILHLGCLKSWLERQQVCPTCRSPVTGDRAAAVATQNNNNANNNNNNNAPGAANAANGNQPQGQQQQGNAADAAGAGQNADPQGAGNRNANGGARVYNLGRLRVGFGNGPEQFRDLAEQLGLPHGGANQARAASPAPTPTTALPTDSSNGASNGADLSSILNQASQMIQRETQNLQIAQQELQVMELLTAELQRLRQRRAMGGSHSPSTQAQTPILPTNLAGQPNQLPLQNTGAQPPLNLPGLAGRPGVVRHGVAPNTPPIPSGSADLPEGLSIPQGWSVLPLQRLDGAVTGGPASRAQSRGPSASPHREAESHLRRQIVPNVAAAQPTPTTTSTAAAAPEGPTEASVDKEPSETAEEPAKDDVAAASTKQSTAAPAVAPTQAPAPAPAPPVAPAPSSSQAEPAAAPEARPVYGPPRPPNFPAGQGARSNSQGGASGQTSLQKAVQDYLKSDTRPSISNAMNSGMTLREFMHQPASPSDFPEGELRDFFFPPSQKQKNGRNAGEGSSAAAAAAATPSSASSTSTSQQQNDQSSKDGKAKAVTVEDVKDEEDEEPN